MLYTLEVIDIWMQTKTSNKHKASKTNRFHTTQDQYDLKLHMFAQDR